MTRPAQLHSPCSLPEAVSQTAADRSYVDTVNKLAQGLQAVLESYAKSQDPHKRRILEIWQSTGKQ